MRNYKLITLSLIIMFVAAAVIFTASRSSQGHYTAPEKKSIKVLRKKDQRGVKPTAQEIAAAQPTPQPERELEDKIPKHLPIKIKVKNLKSEKWVRDLEIEVTNTSDKPIYYLFLILSLPEVKSESNRTMGFQLGYGRDELIDFATPIQSNDVPIKPGESYKLKIPAQFSRGWERFAEKRKLSKSEPKKVLLRFGQLNFGDGTGFSATDGEPIDIHQKHSFNRSWEKNEDKIAPALNNSPARPPDSSRPSPSLFLPANFLPVKLSMAFVSESTSSSADVCGCEGGSCYRLKYAIAACCGNPIRIAASASCSDFAGRCRIVEDEEFPCEGDYPCIGNVLISCPTADPTPPPSPSPSSSPSGSPPPPPCAEDCTRCNPNGSCETNFPPYPFCRNPYCLSGPAANFCTYPQTGCPANAFYGGGGCCKCVNENPSCPDGYYWDTNKCECAPAPTPVPSATPTPGGGYYYSYSVCTDYDWVTYESYDGGQTWHEVDRSYAGCW